MSAAERYGEIADVLHDAFLRDGEINAGDTREALRVGMQAGVALSRATIEAAHTVGDAIGVPIDPAVLLDAVTNGRGC